jgi:hypothetical protein
MKDKWEGEYVQCDLCNYKWVAVFPAGIEKIECPNCHNLVNYEIITEDECI